MKYIVLCVLLFTGNAFCENAVIEKFIKDKISVQSTKLDPSLIGKIFNGDFYSAKITNNHGSFKSHDTQLVHVVNGKVGYLEDTSTNKQMPGLTKLVKKSFKLNSQGNVKEFEKVLDLLYPVSKFGKDKDAKKVVKAAGKVIFVRGKFFKKNKGFVVEVDKSGVVKKISYSLDIK